MSTDYLEVSLVPKPMSTDYVEVSLVPNCMSTRAE